MRLSLEREARQWCLTGRVGNVALAIYVLTDATSEPVVKYLLAVARQRHWPVRAQADVERLVTEAYLSAELHQLFKLVDPDDPLDEA